MTRKQAREWAIFLLVLGFLLQFIIHLWLGAFVDLSGKVNSAFDITATWMLIGSIVFTFAGWSRRNPKDPPPSAPA